MLAAHRILLTNFDHSICTLPGMLTLKNFTLARRYGGLDPAALKSITQQNAMAQYGMGGGASTQAQAQMLQQLYARSGGGSGGSEAWNQRANSLLGSAGASLYELAARWRSCSSMKASQWLCRWQSQWRRQPRRLYSLTRSLSKQMVCVAIAAGYPSQGGLPGMQQPQLPSLGMASRAGMVSPAGQAGNTFFQQQQASWLFSVLFILHHSFAGGQTSVLQQCGRAASHHSGWSKGLSVIWARGQCSETAAASGLHCAGRAVHSEY